MPRLRLPSHPDRLAAEWLRDFPPETVAAYLRFAAQGDPACLDAAVLGLLQHFLPARPPQPLRQLPASTRLTADLGCDSLTLINLVFLAEELFAIHLEDEALAKAGTLGGLLEQFRIRLRDGSAAA